jgi:hypothetical protein
MKWPIRLAYSKLGHHVPRDISHTVLPISVKHEIATTALNTLVSVTAISVSNHRVTPVQTMQQKLTFITSSFTAFNFFCSCR